MANIQLGLAGQGLAAAQLVSEMGIQGLFLRNKSHCLGSLDFIERVEEEELGVKVICKRAWEEKLWGFKRFEGGGTRTYEIHSGKFSSLNSLEVLIHKSSVLTGVFNVFIQSDF